MDCDFSFIKEIDFFGKNPEFYINGKPKKVTCIGRIFTVLYVVIYIIYFAYKLYRMFERVDITFYDINSENEEISSIFLTNENFYLTFSLFNFSDGEPFIDESIYYPIVYFINDETGITEEIETEKCSLDKVGSNYTKLFENQELDKYYCLKKINHTLKTYTNSYNIRIFPCKNNSENNNKCRTKEEIDEYLNYNDFMINFEDILITPNNFQFPIKPRINFVYTTFFKNFGQLLYVEMQLVNIETNNNIIGFDFLTENEKSENFIRFDTLEIIPQPGYDLDDENNNYSVSDIVFQLKDKILVEKREYTQLFDVFGEVGGFMEMISSFFGIISSFIVDILYEKSITNNLFSFDLKNKLVLIKNGKNKTILKRDEIDLNKIESKIQNKKNDGINAPKFPYKNDFKVEMIEIKKDSSKRKFNDNISDTVLNLKKKNNILETNSYDNERGKEKENNKIFHKINKETIFSNENKEILDYIKLNEILIHFCFCFVRNRKNKSNILLNESKNIISQKLDIYNIFRNMYSIEKNNNNFQYDIIDKQMSEK